MTRSVPRHERMVLLAALTTVIVIAWSGVIAGAGMDMSAVEMTRMAGMDGWLMQAAVWTPAYAARIFAMWWVMMVAMMLPSAGPMLLLFARIRRKSQPAHAAAGPTALFAVGYLLAWGGFSALATVLQWSLESARLLSPMLSTTNSWLGAGLLLAAGAWQLAPLKRMCLAQCRTPLGFIVGHWRDGAVGALRMGLSHGAYCLGCCWFLMLLLFFGGVMNLFWIGGLSVYVLLEKSLPLGHGLGRTTGVALMACGLWLAIEASQAL